MNRCVRSARVQLVALNASLVVVAMLVAGCEKFEKLGKADAPVSRYELSKDAAGRTIRLDKQTGDIAIVKDEQIVNLKDGATVEKEQVATRALAEPKFRNSIDVSQYGVRTYLQTAWLDGSILVKFTVSSLEFDQAQFDYLIASGKYIEEVKTNTKAVMPKVPILKDEQRAQIASFAQHVPWNLQMMDPNGFVLDTIVVDLSGATRIVDDSGKTTGIEHKGKRPMPRATYERIASWNLIWH